MKDLSFSELNIYLQTSFKAVKIQGSAHQSSVTEREIRQLLQQI